MYPEALQKVIDNFKKFPGIGEKSAERMALYLLELEEEKLQNFSCAVGELSKKIKKCIICGHITDKKKCDVCADENRDHNLICVLEDSKSVFALEKTGNYKGTYHVLNGLISPIDKINPEDLNISSLIKRVNKLENCELIIALKSTLEGEMTTMYLKKVLESKQVIVSRLSYGIPVGTDIDYLDSLSFEKAINDRKQIS